MSNEESKTPEMSEIENEKLSYIDYIKRNQQILIVCLGYFIAILIDRVFVLDFFYNYPILRLLVMPIFSLSIFISIYIGEKRMIVLSLI